MDDRLLVGTRKGLFTFQRGLQIQNLTVPVAQRLTKCFELRFVPPGLVQELGSLPPDLVKRDFKRVHFSAHGLQRFFLRGEFTLKGLKFAARLL